MNRYIVHPVSASAHCCFEATVMDTTRPDMINDKIYEDEHGKHYYSVCECFTANDAELICKALNSMERKA